ncbi:MAG: hypothetical protein M3Y79_06070 [Pseudomonadota bacterium]|nr:hypothetical protein [Pseudomonadota bacterium]
MEAAFEAEISRLRGSGVLGKGTQMARLFEFLVTCQATGRVPKETEVAIDCFDRGTDVDLTQDATVRVAAHKLRRRLEDFYGASTAPHLTLPRGEYRLVLAEGTPAPAAAAGDPVWWRRLLPQTARERLAGGIILLLLAATVVATTLARRPPPLDPQLARLKASALWAPIFADDLPVQLVLGDYFIFGERDERGDVRRLVRDFSINSRRDLEQGFVADPALQARYADLNLGYLPTSSAQALREVLPVLRATGKPLLLTLASELDPATLKTTHIVYLGYLSALGMLEDMMVASSRYSFGGSYDELVDSVSGAAWTSDAGIPHGVNERYSDYAYLAQLPGPGGHRHLVIAGTRDIGLMQAAETAADVAQLHDLDASVSRDAPFEALFEVQGLSGINVQSRLIEASAIAP